MIGIGDIAPDFETETTEGAIRFHNWIGSDWCLFVSHPKDFTPVCTTELGSLAKLEGEFSRRNVKVIGLSIDSVDDHLTWKADIEETQRTQVRYPMIGDPMGIIAKQYGMIHPNATIGSSNRTAMDSVTVRNVFIIGPDKRIKMIMVYPMSTGRNFSEIIRVIDALQLSAKHPVVTPANWSQGDDVIISLSVSDEQARKVFPEGWSAPKPYLRIVPNPERRAS
jgi:thioredoxin-dependent peroxiredoxin